MGLGWLWICSTRLHISFFSTGRFELEAFIAVEITSSISNDKMPTDEVNFERRVRGIHQYVSIRID